MNVLGLDSSHALAAHQGVLVAVWAGEPLQVQMTTTADRLLELHAAYPGQVLLFSIITENTGMPGPAVRETLKSQFERMRGKLEAAAIVIEHRGILHSLSRTVITSLVTLSRQPFPLKIFADRLEAAAWLARQPGTPKAEALTALAALLLRQMAAAPRATPSIPAK